MAKHTLSEALSNVMLESINQDVQSFLDTLETYPERLSESLRPAMEELIEATKISKKYHEELSEETLTSIEANVDTIRTKAILSLDNSVKHIIDTTLTPELNKLGVLTDKLADFEKPKIRKSSYIIMFAGLLIASIVGSSFSILLDKSISEDYKATLESTRFELDATDAAVQAGMDALSKKQKTIFFNAYKKQIDKEYGVNNK